MRAGFLKKQNFSGFSLIELMVVISIFTLVVGLSLPAYVRIQIKSTRAEIYSVFRSIHALAHSYHAENDQYPNGFNVGSYWSDGYGITGEPFMSSCATLNPYDLQTNVLGFSVSNCEKLRYFYSFTPTGGAGNSIDNSRKTYFTIDAKAVYWEFAPGASLGSSGFDYYGGRKPPVNRCQSWNSGMWVSYYDRWTMFESGVIQPYYNQIASDALGNCALLNQSPPALPWY